MKSDILQIPIRTCEIEEVGALGAGILAAVGCGVFDSIEEGCNHFVRFNKTYEPDNTKSQIYQGCYEKYMELYNPKMKYYIQQEAETVDVIGADEFDKHLEILRKKQEIKQLKKEIEELK